MARKLERKVVAPTATSEAAPPRRVPPLQGQFAVAAGSARNASNLLQETRSLLVEGIIEGKIAVELRPDQIIDEVGPDRLAEEDPEEFEHLVANIAERGQRQPIQVRPVDPEWRPDASHPLEVDATATFALQSGRRRLAACVRLGTTVRAAISGGISSDVRLSDLEERFFENTARKQLSPFEEFVAIGLIAEMHPRERQVDLAKRLGRPQSYISWGKDCLRLGDRIKELRPDANSLTKTQITQLLPELKREEEGEEKGGIPARILKSPQQKDTKELPLSNGGALKVKSRAKGITLSVDGLKLSGERGTAFEKELRDLVEKYLSRQ